MNRIIRSHHFTPADHALLVPEPVDGPHLLQRLQHVLRRTRGQVGRLHGFENAAPLSDGHVPAQQNPRSPRQAEQLKNVPILDSGIRVAGIEKLAQALTARQYGRNDALLEDPRLRQSKSAVFMHERVQLLPQDAEDPLVVGDEDAPHVVDAAHGNVSHHVLVQGEEFKIVQLASYLVHLFQDPSLNGNQLRRPLGHGRVGASDAVEGESRRFGTARDQHETGRLYQSWSHASSLFHEAK